MCFSDLRFLMMAVTASEAVFGYRLVLQMTMSMTGWGEEEEQGC